MKGALGKQNGYMTIMLTTLFMEFWQKNGIIKDKHVLN